MDLDVRYIEIWSKYYLDSFILVGSVDMIDLRFIQKRVWVIKTSIARAIHSDIDTFNQRRYSCEYAKGKKN